ncbi:MAG: N-acyl-D-amino-acid deacylase family protein [Chitinophagaceae bacterium]
MKNKKIITTLFFIPLTTFTFAQQADLIIKNGKIIDGTGNSWYYGDVAISNGKIIYTGKAKNISASKTIDAKGLIVAPGFIDVHTHIEGEEAKNPTANNFILDGVTTVVTGNCGASNVNIQKYFRYLDSVKLSINVATLIGHNDVRKEVMGTANRPPTQTELQQMEALVATAMKDGAVGLSTGLIYIPGTYSHTEEIVALAKIAAQYNGLYATHMRDESDSVVQAISEALTVGTQANIPVEISHFKVGGQQNWGRSKQTLQMIKEARSQGLEVTIDQYPYTASSTSLSTLLPDEILADGTDSIKTRLQRPEERKYVIDYILRKLKNRKLKHLSYAVVASHRADTTYNGKSIEEINLIKGKKHNAKNEAETVIELMLNGGAGMVFHGMSEDDVRYIIQYPFNMFASDAGIRLYKQGVPHPRGYGTNARVLSKYVRDEKIISLEEAIRRMTSLPAQKFQLKDRGLLKEGMAADVVIFDEKEVQDMATFQDPHQYSKGFKYVIVNGKTVVENGNHTGVKSGAILTGPGTNKIL